MKMRIEAQQLQPGDIVGSGEKVVEVTLRSINWPSHKCSIKLEKLDGMRSGNVRQTIWGRYTMINIDRPDSNRVTGFQVHEPKSWNGFSHK